MRRIILYLKALSPLTFLSSILSALIGASIAFSLFHSIDLLKLGLVLIFLILIHSGVNLYNDYRDYVTGVDLEYRRRHVLHRLNMIIDLGVNPLVIRNISILLVIISSILGGILLVNLSILPVVVLIVLGIIIGLGYSSPIFKFRYRGVGEIVAGIATGPLISCGSFIVLTNSIGITGILIASIAGLCNGLYTTMILVKIALSRYHIDISRGKRTLPVIIGIDSARKLLYVFTLIIYVIPIILYVLNYVSLIALLSLISAPLTLLYIRRGKPFSLFVSRIIVSMFICLGFILH